MRIYLVIFFCTVIAISSCKRTKGPEPVACTQEARAGINVTVKAAENGALLYDSVVVVITDGAYTETLMGADPVNKTFSGAFERTGTYMVTAMHPSYQTGALTGILVTRDECHVIPQQVNMTLTHK